MQFSPSYQQFCILKVKLESDHAAVTIRQYTKSCNGTIPFNLWPIMQCAMKLQLPLAGCTLLLWLYVGVPSYMKVSLWNLPTVCLLCMVKPWCSGYIRLRLVSTRDVEYLSTSFNYRIISLLKQVSVDFFLTDIRTCCTASTVRLDFPFHHSTFQSSGWSLVFGSYQAWISRWT